jgi:hypothetical protein
MSLELEVLDQLKGVTRELPCTRRSFPILVTPSPLKPLQLPQAMGFVAERTRGAGW